jgi:hypothetical protein
MPKTRPEKKPNGAHAEFIQHFVACWERRYPGVKYPFTPADASAAKRILAAVGPAGDWRGIVERYCRSPDSFIAEKMRHSLRYLQQCLPKFAVDPNAPKPFIEDN